MAKDGNELRFVLPLIGGCLLAIILFHALYTPEFRVVAHDGWFLAAYIPLMLTFGYYGVKCIIKRDDDKANKDRWIVIIVAALLCTWIGVWCSQYRADKSSNIEYKYDKN